MKDENQATVGIDVDKVKKSIEGIKRNVEQITVEAVNYYQTNVIDLLEKGWVSKSGKERIEYIANGFNEINTLIIDKVTQIIDAIEETAVAIAEANDESYTSTGISIAKVDYNADDACEKYNGSSYIISQYLRDAKSKLEQYVDNRIDKNYGEIMTCAFNCGLLSKDQELREKIMALLDSLRNNSTEKIDSMIYLINHSLSFKSDQADAARALGDAALNVAPNINK